MLIEVVVERNPLWGQPGPGTSKLWRCPGQNSFLAVLSSLPLEMPQVCLV